ncbi:MULTISPECIES: hypothetical protein [unclassified Thermosipho (in: thermotogales)]|uniref:hypothetical protein n=1 Tax=unclassified Thermosipho (in: thermotogales) TaxID=2676525 RepID=UPI000985C097|nr:MULTISPECIES: hypothetical protein [unclassified Thermosipho (in: thermotogales)]MBT1247362.1 hypothetical protein [Thermosipho sp. 1244]OOC46960.1 hypothetical protein XO09_04175 [Thermosipho sp. 1223]
MENDERVVIIPLGRSILKHWVDNNYLRKLGKPEIHIYDGDKIENKKKVEEVNSRGGKNKGFVTKKREIENYVHPQIPEKIFRELSENTLINRAQDDWIVEWNELDVAKKIKNMVNNLRESKIKEKICTEGVEKMTIELFEELQAYNEIKEWFSAIKDAIK